MDTRSTLTPRTPTRPHRDPVVVNTVVTPIVSNHNSDILGGSDMDTIDALIFQRIPSHTPNLGNNPKRQKRDAPFSNSPSEYTELNERLNRLEGLVTKLISTVNDKGIPHNIPATTNKETSGIDTQCENEEQFDDLSFITKDTKSYFYHIYGQLKSMKTTFSRELLSDKLSDIDFATFKEVRTSLTMWLKTGLALSRQLEDLHQSPTVILPPLLTIRFFATEHEQEYETYLNNAETQRRDLLSKIILKANA